jgi:hypothetical protein
MLIFKELRLMPPENVGSIDPSKLAATAAAYDVLSALGPDAAVTMQVHTPGPDGRTIAQLVEAQRSNPDFLAMRREYTAQAAAAVGIIHLGENTQE